MFKNMQTEIAENGIEKFIGFFGGDHTTYQSTTSLPNAFENTSEFKNKVLTIKTFCFNAFDNWSHEILECIGTYSQKEGYLLHEKYMNDNRRAILIPYSGVSNDIPRKTADYYLFANDKTIQ